VQHNLSSILEKTFAYYQALTDQGFPVQHHILLYLANKLWAESKDAMLPALFSTIHASKWAWLYPFDIAVMTAWMESLDFTSMQGRASVPFFNVIVQNVLVQGLHITPQFLHSAERAVSRCRASPGFVELPDHGLGSLVEKLKSLRENYALVGKSPFGYRDGLSWPASTFSELLDLDQESLASYDSAGELAARNRGVCARSERAASERSASDANMTQSLEPWGTTHDEEGPSSRDTAAEAVLES